MPEKERESISLGTRVGSRAVLPISSGPFRLDFRAEAAAAAGAFALSPFLQFLLP